MSLLRDCYGLFLFHCWQCLWMVTQPWRMDLGALMTISSFVLLSIVNTLFSSAEYFQAVSGECTTPTSTTMTGSVADCEVRECTMKYEDFCQQKYHIAFAEIS